MLLPIESVDEVLGAPTQIAAAVGGGFGHG
jgi:hypothetical protein